MRKYMLIHHAYLEDNTTTPCEIKIKKHKHLLGFFATVYHKKKKLTNILT